MENLWPSLKRRSKAQTIVGIWIIRRFKKDLKRFAWGEYGGRRRRSGSMRDIRM